MMRRDAAAARFVANAFVNHAIHPGDQLTRCQAAPGINRATQLAIDNVPDAFQDAAHQTLRQDRVASSFRWILFVSH